MKNKIMQNALDLVKTEGTEGTKGTASNGEASSGSPGKKQREPIT